MPDNSFDNTVQTVNTPFKVIDKATGNVIYTLNNDGTFSFSTINGGQTFASPAGGTYDFYNSDGNGIFVELNCVGGPGSVPIINLLNDPANGQAVLGVNGVQVVGAQVGAISSPTLTSPSANETALLTALNAILAALRGSTGHGLIAG